MKSRLARLCCTIECRCANHTRNIFLSFQRSGCAVGKKSQDCRSLGTFWYLCNFIYSTVFLNVLCSSYVLFRDVFAQKMFFGAFLLCIAMSNAAQLTFFPNSTTSGSPGSSTSSSGTKTSSADAASSSDEGYPICRTGDPYMTLWAFNPYDTSNFPNNIVPPNTALANYCSADWSRSFAEYISTAPVTTSTAVEVTTTTNSDAQITSFTTTEVDVWYNGPAFSYPTKSPCCLNCTLFGGTVQVYYWPTAAPNATAPPVTALVDRNNHTL